MTRGCLILLLLFIQALSLTYRRNQVLLNQLNLSGKTLFNYSQRILARHSQVCLWTSEFNKTQIRVSALLLSRTGPQRGQSTRRGGAGGIENVRAKAGQSFLPTSSQDAGLHDHQALMKIKPEERTWRMVSERTGSTLVHNLTYWKGLWLGSQASSCFWTHLFTA